MSLHLAGYSYNLAHTLPLSAQASSCPETKESVSPFSNARSRSTASLGTLNASVNVLKDLDASAVMGRAPCQEILMDPEPCHTPGPGTGI